VSVELILSSHSRLASATLEGVAGGLGDWTAATATGDAISFNAARLRGVSGAAASSAWPLAIIFNAARLRGVTGAAASSAWPLSFDGI
jgi:hypothetical protein